MKIGLWNIDHPETASGNDRKEQRFEDIAAYLVRADCDAYIITEANAAMELSGYTCETSVKSPFLSSRRFYGSPNIYHQVAIYSKTPIVQTEIAEPVNGLQVTLGNTDELLALYGNVVTIKDQWDKSSDLTYTDRLNQQIDAIRSLPQERALVGGDFNLRLGWKQKLTAHRRIKEELRESGWLWPTEEREDTVQHVMHSPDLHAELRFDFSVMYNDGRTTGLSDHPFIEIAVLPGDKKKA